MNCNQVINALKSLADPDYLAGMTNFAIHTDRALGVSAPRMRKLAKEIGTNHKLALELWESGIHEAMVIAALIDDLKRVTKSQMNNWVRQFDNWAVCDVCCGMLFDKTPFAWDKAIEWPQRKEEFVRRAGFVLMAALAVHDKRAPDKKFLPFFNIIKRYADDERNFVKKAVNWALRQIGKRNKMLNKKAVAVAKEIRKTDSPAARWIAADAIRELTNKKILARLRS
ncbi:MAG: DNA alkylation repair protein [Sedimentisphaerales bacterium]|jgi:3-methyladenine DNA glycosylase AlkD